MVRPATEDDLPRAVALIGQLWQAHDEDDYDDASLRARTEQIMQTRDCYMIEHEGASLAFASLQEAGDHVVVRHFSLEASERGKGLGRAAFQALEAHAFPGRNSRLYASNRHPGPKAFWEKMGYHVFAYTMERKGDTA